MLHKLSVRNTAVIVLVRLLWPFTALVMFLIVGVSIFYEALQVVPFKPVEASFKSVKAFSLASRPVLSMKLAALTKLTAFTRSTSTWGHTFHSNHGRMCSI